MVLEGKQKGELTFLFQRRLHQKSMYSRARKRRDPVNRNRHTCPNHAKSQGPQTHGPSPTSNLFQPSGSFVRSISPVESPTKSRRGKKEINHRECPRGRQRPRNNRVTEWVVAPVRIISVVIRLCLELGRVRDNFRQETRHLSQSTGRCPFPPVRPICCSVTESVDKPDPLGGQSVVGHGSKQERVQILEPRVPKRSLERSGPSSVAPRSNPFPNRAADTRKRNALQTPCLDASKQGDRRGQLYTILEFQRTRADPAEPDNRLNRKREPVLRVGYKVAESRLQKKASGARVRVPERGRRRKGGFLSWSCSSRDKEQDDVVRQGRRLRRREKL